KRHRSEDPKIQQELNIALGYHVRAGNERGVNLCLWAGVSADGRSPENAEIGSPPTTSENVPSPIAIGRRDRCWDWRTS
ncbi:MAG TPA: hypothetical protein VFG59_15820, partial [Anaeromyxobacter sp.]|nr:hypothetical protein [Anaeromyxobacter sp.]